jgi:hypothetical protein
MGAIVKCHGTLVILMRAENKLVDVSRVRTAENSNHGGIDGSGHV